MYIRNPGHMTKKTLKMSYKVKVLQEWAVGLNINDSEKNGPQGLIFPHPGALYMQITIIFKYLLL